MPKPDPDISTVFSFFNEIGIISQLSSRLFEKHLPEGFLISHFSVLNHLVRMGDRKTPKSIARALQVPKTTITHTLAGLIKARFIAFEPNPQDSRSKFVILTQAGRHFREDSIARLVPKILRLCEAILPRNFAGSLPLLEETRAYLDKARTNT